MVTNRKITKKLLKISGLLAISIVVPLSLVSCVKSEENIIPYDGSLNSLKAIANNIKYDSFDVDMNIKLVDLKATDFKWKNSQNYPNLKLLISEFKKYETYKPSALSDITFTNAAVFRFVIYDKTNPSIYYQPNSQIIKAYFK